MRNISVGMKIKNIRINEQPSVTTDEGQSHLYWPIYSYDNDGWGIVKTDMSSFPCNDVIVNSYKLAKEWRSAQDSNRLVLQGRPVRGSVGINDEEFWSNLGDCTVAYIVDKKFSPAEFKLMLSFLQKDKNISLQSISIFCRNDVDELHELNNKREKTEFNIAIYQIPELPLYEIHDRFAVLDDEIWHFGGTVGGINPQLTAYSRGWKDYDGSFREYIKSMIVQK